MLTSFPNAKIADLDGTVEGEPCHPAKVLVVTVRRQYKHVIVPPDVSASTIHLLRVGQRVKIVGELRGTNAARTPIVVASQVDLLADTNRSADDEASVDNEMLAPPLPSSLAQEDM